MARYCKTIRLLKIATFSETVGVHFIFAFRTLSLKQSLQPYIYANTLYKNEFTYGFTFVLYLFWKYLLLTLYSYTYRNIFSQALLQL